MKHTKSGKEIKKRTITLVVITLLGLIPVMLFSTQKISTFIGTKYTIQGVDVSHFQGDIDWSVLERQGISFAYIKATEGSSYVDPYLDKNYQGIQTTGLDYGFYHFLSLDSSPETQFENFKSAVGDYHMDIIPAIDIEWYGDKRQNPPEKEAVLSTLSQMISLFEQEYGQKPVVYTTHSFYNKYFRGETPDYPIWIRNVYFCPSEEWTIWQYTDRSVMDGYYGDEKYIDRDVIRDSDYNNLQLK